MDYTEITDLALAYSDREDEDVTDKIDGFLKITESRINRALRVAKMSVRSIIGVIAEEAYYGLPADFGGLRDIEWSTSESAKKTMTYRNPEQMNNFTFLDASGDTGRVAGMYYTLIAQQIQIWPPQAEGNIEIVYYQKLPALTESDPNNWLSDGDPDAYIFGLLVEISSYVKDKDAATLWDGRFKESVEAIVDEDAKDRWSGTPLKVMVG